MPNLHTTNKIKQLQNIFGSKESIVYAASEGLCCTYTDDKKLPVTWLHWDKDGVQYRCISLINEHMLAQSVQDRRNGFWHGINHKTVKKEVSIECMHVNYIVTRMKSWTSMDDDDEVSEDEYICILSTFVFLCRLQVGIIKRVSLRICFHLPKSFPTFWNKWC